MKPQCASPLYSLRNVRKVFREGRGKGAVETIALEDATFDIREGEFVAILGRSGEGKSTLLSLLGGLDRASDGDLSFGGESLARLDLASFRRDNVGFVFQMFHLLPFMTAARNVALGYSVARPADAAGAMRRAEGWLNRLGLGHRLKHRPSKLSGGERQRVAIARAMIKEPRVLLADEPTGNLDSKSRLLVLDSLRTINESGTTVVLVTHNEDDATHYAHRVLRLVERRVVET